jgi:hypothetical protein
MAALPADGRGPGVMNFALLCDINEQMPHANAISEGVGGVRRANQQISVESFAKKYSGSLFTQITSTSLAIPHPQEGRFAIVTNVGRGMRWTRGALLTRALVLADGEVVWS